MENAGTRVLCGNGPILIPSGLANSGDFTSDGNIDASGDTVVPDYDPGYGGLWNFSDFDSGVRLGEDAVTPVAVYATWVRDPNGELLPGQQWEDQRVHDHRNGGWADAYVPVASMQADSPGNDSPVPNDRPWKLLGRLLRQRGSTLTVTLGYAAPDGADRRQRHGAAVHQRRDDPCLMADGEHSAGQHDGQLQVAAANASEYVDWVDACQPIRSQWRARATAYRFNCKRRLRHLYSQIPGASMSDWQASLNIDPAKSGLGCGVCPTAAVH